MKQQESESLKRRKKAGSTSTGDRHAGHQSLPRGPKKFPPGRLSPVLSKQKLEKLLEDTKANVSIQPKGVKYVLQTGEKARQRTLLSLVQWCFTGVCVLRSITVKTLLDVMTVFCNSDSSIHM